MTLALADVCDLDCVASSSPLVLDLPPTERYARGQRAIGQRVLYSWASEGALLELDGRSWDRGDLMRLRSLYTRLAESEDYVLSAAVTVELDGSTLAIGAALVLADGATYLLEVSAGDAVSVVFPEG